MFKVYYGNRLEELLRRLVALTDQPLSDPMAAEVVVTQSQGMARWLTLGMAEHRSVAANIDFVLPAAFVWRVLSGAIGGRADGSRFEREVLVWRLMDVLPRWVGEPGFEPLARYLRGERPELKRFQLCRRLADVFDQYLVFRPDLILEWDEGGEPEDWQARLWRSLSGHGDAHRAALMRDFLDEGLHLDPALLPERVCVFGIPSLPPAYLQVLAKVAGATDVHLFVLNPCLQFWGDIEDPRHIARLRDRRTRIGRPPEEDYLTSGNSLLASLGRQGRDFIDALHEQAAEEEELFEAPTVSGALGVVQTDMLTLEERGGDVPALPFDPEDDSIQVHVCHSPLREVEVLHDRLLARFDTDPTLQPQDVVVMTPDIEQYAPYIEAVFGAAPESRRIPWAVADLSRESEHPVVQAFLQLLDLPGSRFTANDVLSLLENPAVLRRHGLSFADFETVRRWVRESGIRWGLDAESRRALDLPSMDANTWAFGFRRLFLGYAMPPSGERLFGEVLPYPHVEGQDSVVLGRLRAFVDRLATFADRLAERRTANEWAALINALLEAFFEPDGDDAEPLQVIRDAAATLVSETESAGFEGAFGIDVLRDHLRGLTAASSEQRFLTGRVTFCAMVPMRSLPFRVIAMIGMNDGAFPRQQRPLGFDRMAEKPRRGDRSRREDDRYLFLEALVSTREQLYISYVGRNVRDNSPMLPSVLVAELLDYLDQAFTTEQGAARRYVTVEHPLQPFSERYFDGGPTLFSFAGEWLPASRVRREQSAAVQPFCSGPLPDAAAASEVELDALRRYFRHPARAFLQERLGIRLGADHDALDDSEPFELDGLARHFLHTELLDHLLDGGCADSYRAVLKARGDLPVGSFADRLLDDETVAVEELADRIRPHLSQPLEPREVDLKADGWRLVGWLDGLTAEGLLRYRAGNVKAADRIDLWLQHLVLNALAPGDCPRTSRLIGRDGETVLPPVDEAWAELDRLVGLYRDGIRSPLPLMPASAFAHAEAAAAGKDADKAADKVWRSTDYHRGEDADEHFRMAFRGINPLDEPFADLAAAVYGPLVEAMQRGAASS